ncbi:uncharacterized protein BT62DRAFT_901672 [Guyanagaster necrorhizus]|uniref:Reverse transcriptase zinc-binding domain-containing protein n=1 Tax=Guyanagaster necrorhizus TaxID=856835 RepID=A0A9P8AQK4_9AGAR|nr:uncharacterized protein BT62DRAFT_901672 [Guyanagaster necrorhizus MCA 3950]KAG7443946.1 hypothetical protein BT62DRAFT_901672 [Guyanagaster necrorhizus MCA 3950]
MPSTKLQTSQAREVVAIKELLAKTNKRVILYNKKGSKYVLNHLSKTLKRMKDMRYIGVSNKKILQVMVASFQSCKQNKYHGIYNASRLAKEGAEHNQDDMIDLEVDPKLKITSASLSKLMQSQAYKAFQERKNQNLPLSAKTNTNMKLASQGVNEYFSMQTTSTALWKSICHKDIDLNTRYFLWMTMHNAYRIGEKWPNFIPQYHSRAYCAHCNNSIENMEHILTECSTPGQNEVWEFTKNLLEQ